MLAAREENSGPPLDRLQSDDRWIWLRRRQLMSSSTPLESVRHIAWVLWFPILFALALPFVWEITFHAPQPHEVPIAVVGNRRQVEAIRADLQAVKPGGFNVTKYRSATVAAEDVSSRQLAAAYVEVLPPGDELLVARAASAISANYLQSVFTAIATEAHQPPPRLVDLVPLLSGDSGTGIFFFTFPMMMVGVITVLVLLQKAPTWSVEQRSLSVVGTGAVGALIAYATSVNLDVLPNKPVLLLLAFTFSQVIGQLLVGLVPFLKQYFLPVVMTFVMIVSVPSAGATMAPDLIPTGLRYLSAVLPLAQTAKIARSVAYFDGEQTLGPWLILLGWGVIALATLGLARHSLSGPVTAASATQDVGSVTVSSFDVPVPQSG